MKFKKVKVYSKKQLQSTKSGSKKMTINKESGIIWVIKFY